MVWTVNYIDEIPLVAVGRLLCWENMLDGFEFSLPNRPRALLRQSLLLALGVKLNGCGVGVQAISI